MHHLVHNRLIKECWSRRLRCIRLMQLVQPSRHEYNFMPIYELHSLRVRVRSPCGDTFLVYARAYKLADPAHRARLSRQSRRQLLSFARWLLQAPACLTHSKLAVYNSACWAWNWVSADRSLTANLQSAGPVNIRFSIKYLWAVPNAAYYYGFLCGPRRTVTK